MRDRQLCAVTLAAASVPALLYLPRLGWVWATAAAAISALLAEQAFGQAVTIPYSRFLACLLQCPGVADYSSFTVNGETAVVSIAAEAVPVVGTVNVTET